MAWRDISSNIYIFAERKLRRYISVNTARLRYEERRWEKKQKRRNTFSSFNFGVVVTTTDTAAALWVRPQLFCICVSVIKELLDVRIQCHTEGKINGSVHSNLKLTNTVSVSLENLLLASRIKIVTFHEFISTLCNHTHVTTVENDQTRVSDTISSACIS